MTAPPTAKMATPVGPVLGSRRWMRMEGKPPTGGMSCLMGMSLTDYGVQDRAEEGVVQRAATPTAATAA
jgi:hypothetical protein